MTSKFMDMASYINAVCQRIKEVSVMLCKVEKSRV